MAGTIKANTSGSAGVSMTGQYGLNAEDPFAKFIGATDSLAASLAFNQIVSQYSTTPSKADPNVSMATYMQQMLRSKGYSKDTTPIGFYGPGDSKALSDFIQTAVRSNIQNIPISDLTLSLIESTDAKGGAAKGPAYSKTISTALQYKDAGDAAYALSNAWFKAFGSAPSQVNIDTFKNQWNAELKAQTKPTTTTSVSKKGTVAGKAGTIATTKTVTGGEGFTADEQTKFLADFLVNNYPKENWDVKTIGGQVRDYYNELAGASSNNYLSAPTMADLSDAIAQAVASNDPAITKEIMTQQKNKMRMVASKQWQGIADEMIANNMDASEFINPLLKSLSSALETTVDANDPLVKSIVNYTDKSGKVRMANAAEQQSLVMKDARYWATASSKNFMSNLGGKVMNALGRG